MICRDHTFPEEREPSGRLILAPCLSCGLAALEAMDDLRAKCVDRERERAFFEAAKEEARLTLVLQRLADDRYSSDDVCVRAAQERDAASDRRDAAYDAMQGAEKQDCGCGPEAHRFPGNCPQEDADASTE